MNDLPRQRIAPAERLRGRDSIHRVFENGFSARRGRVLARFVFSEGGSPQFRFGVTASRTVQPAVLRNRCKRLLREAVRTCKQPCVERIGTASRSVDVMFIWLDAMVTDRTELLPEISQSISELLDIIARAATDA